MPDLDTAPPPVTPWTPPEDRPFGYRCLGWTEDGWVCVQWVAFDPGRPEWISDWYPYRDDVITVFAPLPPPPEGTA